MYFSFMNTFKKSHQLCFFCVFCSSFYGSLCFRSGLVPLLVIMLRPVCVSSLSVELYLPGFSFSLCPFVPPVCSSSSAPASLPLILVITFCVLSFTHLWCIDGFIPQSELLLSFFHMLPLELFLIEAFLLL